MLEGDRHILPLGGADIGRAQPSGQKGVFAEILKIPAAKRISVDIYCWGKPYSKIVLLHFFGTSRSAAVTSHEQAKALAVG